MFPTISRRRSPRLAVVTTGAVVAMTVGTLFSLPALADIVRTERVSLDVSGAQANNDSYHTSIDADGRYVAFASSASNHVVGDTNNVTDVFVYDRETGVTERVSQGSAGDQANGHSIQPEISADGRYVAFFSLASNLVPVDQNLRQDVFVHDRVTGATELVGEGPVPAQSSSAGFGVQMQPAISADGRYVAFASDTANGVAGDTNGRPDIFVRDRLQGTTGLVSVGLAGASADGASVWPSISHDGRYVAFESLAGNLVSGDTNAGADVFVRDRTDGTTELLSVGTTGNPVTGASTRPAISADGRYVAFNSDAPDLVAADVNGGPDVFVRDRQDDVTQLVSVTATGDQAAHGPFAYGPAISDDGRLVTFGSAASDLVPGDTNASEDIFLRDHQGQATERISVSASGVQGDWHSYDPVISGDGQVVAYESWASNLVLDDTNRAEDIFVLDRRCGPEDPCDFDGDGLANADDNCPEAANAGQDDADGDGVGTACDPVELPATKQACSNEGWRRFYDGTVRFRNEGDCVSFVASGGRTTPRG